MIRSQKTFEAVTKPTLDALSTYTKNILKRNLATTPNQLNGLKRYKNEMRQLAKRSTGVRKRRVVLQRADFFPLLMRDVGPLLPSLLK